MCSLNYVHSLGSIILYDRLSDEESEAQSDLYTRMIRRGREEKYKYSNTFFHFINISFHSINNLIIILFVSNWLIFIHKIIMLL